MAGIRWPAGLWLALLMLASTASALGAGWINIAEEDTHPAKLEGDNNAAGFFHRLTVPLAAAVVGDAVASGPNMMAVDATEKKQQQLAALEREQELLRRRREWAAERRAAPAPAPAPAAVIARAQPLDTTLPAWTSKTKTLSPPSSTAVSPSVFLRQDDGQVAALSAQLQSLSLVASSVSQASRSVSQTSQQLAQQVTQLSQSTDRLSQSINSLQQSAQQAQQSAQQAQDAARQASQSATSAISSAISSAQSSAASVMAANLASASSSAANMIAAASASALNIANAAASQVQAAQADATVARADAASQVQKAQGTAVSVSQAALAIVGTFFGSSLLTIGAFYLILRYKSKQRQRRRTQLIAERGDTRYPAGRGDRGDDGDDSDNRANGNDSAYGYPIDLKSPPRRPSGENNDGNTEKYKYNETRRPSSDYRTSIERANGSADADAGFGFATFGSGSGSSIGGPLRKNSGSGEQFSLFPKTPTALQGSNSNANIYRPAASPSIYATGTSAMTATLTRAATTSNNPTRQQPSLQQWLREGTVSPFGTLKREVSQSGDGSLTLAVGGGPGPNAGPERRQQQLRAMMKRSIGVGGVNAGGGSGGVGRVMQPGGALPFREGK